MLPAPDLLLLAAFVASLVSIIRHHRKAVREKKEWLERLARMHSQRER